MTVEFDLLVAFETHDLSKIREILDAGLDPRFIHPDIDDVPHTRYVAGAFTLALSLT